MLTAISVAAMEQQFQDELCEAPYIAKLQKVLHSVSRWPSGPSQVLEFLYLGGEEDASNLKLLESLGITHVINCASSYIQTSQDFYGPAIKYVEYDAEDDEDYQIMQHFDDAYGVIEEARKCGGKAFIHCIMGVNRSGALATAYCMVHKNMGPVSAARFVLKSRPMLLSNEGFQRQLVTFSRQKGLMELDKDLL